MQIRNATGYQNVRPQLRNSFMSIINNAKEIADLIKKMGDIELYRKIVELEGEIIDLTREKNDLTEKNQSLLKSLQISEEMIFKAPFYYRAEDPIPHCPKCWEADSSAIHLIHDWDGEAERHFSCPNCKTAAYAR